MFPLVALALTIQLAGMMLMGHHTTVLGMDKEPDVLIMATLMPTKVSQLIKLAVYVVEGQQALLQHQPRSRRARLQFQAQLQARVLRPFQSQMMVFSRAVPLTSSTLESLTFVSI